MKEIDKIDRNLSVETDIDTSDADIFDAKELSLHGVKYIGGRYRRMEEEVAKCVNQGVWDLHAMCAGGRVRFKTDSSFVFIKAEMDGILRMPHIPLTGSSGFDMYADKIYAGTFVPPYDMKDGYESKIVLGESKEREITVNFPTYSQVKELYIGIKKGSSLSMADGYKISRPVVYYGSSITQGGCVSRPGITYQEIISRKFNCDYINLGFSGSAQGEDIMAEYIANIRKSVFIMDYDYNSPTEETLMNTHEKMFLTFREKNPDVPVVMITSPTRMFDPKRAERQRIIKKTYDNAVNRGDRNVYCICGEDMLNYADPQIMTVDGVHPNDFGFWCMAEVLSKTLEKIFV